DAARGHWPADGALHGRDDGQAARGDWDEAAPILEGGLKGGNATYSLHRHDIGHLLLVYRRQPMTTETNKALVRRWVEEAINQGRLETIDETHGAEHVNHFLPPGAPQGIEGEKMLT